MLLRNSLALPLPPTPGSSCLEGAQRQLAGEQERPLQTSPARSSPPLLLPSPLQASVQPQTTAGLSLW